MSGQAFFVKLRALSHVLVNYWLTPGKFYEMSREDPEIGFVMGDLQTHPPNRDFSGFDLDLDLAWGLSIGNQGVVSELLNSDSQ